MPLLVLNIALFIVQISVKGFTDSFALVSSEIYSRPWILFTSMFLHGGFEHLFFNMYALLIFGTFLEQRINPKRFLLAYLASGLLAAFISSFFYKSALGASGAIMGIIGMLIVLMPELRLLFFFIIPMPLWVAGIIWFALDALGIFFPSGVGNIAHITGMAFGLAAGFYLKKQKKKFTKKFSSKPHLESEDIDEYLRSGKI